MRNLIHGLIAALSLAALPVASDAAVFVGVSVGIAPPALPVYVQPPCPAPGYIWVPGYWAWDDDQYYWVPGTWELAPVVGYLWTPGYWGWDAGFYAWHAGYWGPHVGFYGGINYGFGYFGHGYEGGYWRGNQFYYNRSVTNINVTNITNVYNRTVVNDGAVSRVSFHGGAGGVAVRPTAAEMAVEHERHIGITPMQRQHEQMARSDTSLRASVNGGRPAIAATARPATFTGRGVVAARGASPAPRAPAAAMNRTDRPPQTQRNGGPRVGSGGPRADRPAQALQPANPRPPAYQAARPAVNPPQRGNSEYRPQPQAHPQAHAQAHAQAPPGGGPAMHPAAPRAPQAGPPPAAQHPGVQRPAAEREQRERGH
jgi:WXXGXW repeat (2 copies)